MIFINDKEIKLLDNFSLEKSGDIIYIYNVCLDYEDIFNIDTMSPIQLVVVDKFGTGEIYSCNKILTRRRVNEPYLISSIDIFCSLSYSTGPQIETFFLRKRKIRSFC